MQTTVDFDTSIADFLALGRRLQAVQSLTGEQVLEELVTWYRDQPIAGTLSDDDDMLLLQWGTTCPLNLHEPTDLRPLSDSEVTCDKAEVRFLDFTRQVFAPGSDSEVEFDDAAVHMSIMLCYGPATNNEPGYSLYIGTPDDLEIDQGKRDFRSVPFVESHLTVPAHRVIVTVGYCG